MRSFVCAALISVFMLTSVHANAEEHLYLYSDIVENNPFPPGMYDHHLYLYNSFFSALMYYQQQYNSFMQQIGGPPGNCGFFPDDPICQMITAFQAAITFFAGHVAHQDYILTTWP